MENNLKILTNILEEQGVFFDEKDLTTIIDLDSLQYVETIIEIENQFNIEIPEEYLYEKELHTIADYLEIINKVCEVKNE